MFVKMRYLNKTGSYGSVFLIILMILSGCSTQKSTPSNSEVALSQTTTAPSSLVTSSAIKSDQGILGRIWQPIKIVRSIIDGDKSLTSAPRRGSWTMEGQNLQRTRTVNTHLPPPLFLSQSIDIAEQTQLGSQIISTRNLLLVEGDHSLYALDVDHKKTYWSVKLPGSFFSPAVAEDHLFIRAELGEDGYIMALNMASGEEIWQYHFPQVGSHYGNIGGHVTSPVVANGLVLVGASLFFRALDAETGQEVWAFNTGEPITSSAAVADQTVFFNDFQHLRALDIATGQERWHFNTGDETVTLQFAPVIIDDQVITTSNNTAYALNRHTGDIVWQRTISDEPLIPAGADQEHVYIKSTKQLYALDKQTGTLRWSFGVPTFVSLPAITSKHIYVVTRAGGQAQLRALDQIKGTEKWQIQFANLANAAPAIANDQIFLKTVDGRVLIFQKD